jgi:hypothetical protein
MKRALAFLALCLCAVGWYRHRVRRASPMGAFRCDRCGRAFADLDAAGERGDGFVGVLRPQYSRQHGGEIERAGER